MEKRKLGNSAIEVAPLAFGGNVFGWTIDEPTSFKLLDAFIDAGFNLIDTADSYSRWAPGHKGGESETIIGNWMKHRGDRDKIIIATKVGSDMGEGNNLKRDYIFRSVEDSLSRLQTNYIDLYQSHFDDLTTPGEETMEAYAKLIQQGKVRNIGASNLSIERLKGSNDHSKAKGLPRYETLQPHYNLYDRVKFEKESQAYCVENSISVLPYFSLASGFLTGKYRSEKDFSKSLRGSSMDKYMNERGFKILQALDDVSEKYNTKPATVSLAWLLAQPTIAAPIASATNTGQLHELVSATDLRLDKDAIDLLNKASDYSN